MVPSREGVGRLSLAPRFDTDMHANADVAKIMLQALLHGSVEYCSIIDSEYRLVWINWNECREDVIGKFCYAVYQQRRKPCARCPVRDALDMGQLCVMEKSIKMRDGSQRKGEISAYPVHDSKNSLSYVLKIGQGSTSDEVVRLKGQRSIGDPAASSFPLRQKPPPVDESRRALSGETTLTSRERQVLLLLAQGRTNLEIARILTISRHTVKSHVTNVFNKLGVSSRAHATLRAARLELL
jgi:DNA-binding CsgD family transcriptional regulator